MAKAENKKRPRPAAAGGRVRKLSKKQQKTKAKQEVGRRKSIMGSWRLSWQVLRIFRQHWRPLGGIVVVYLILNIIFASGISNVSGAFSSIKTDLNGGGSNLWHAAAGFASLVGSAGASSSATGSALQSILLVLESLVIIWALRHLLSGQTITVKQAYYKATAPLVPFLLVIFTIIIQLLPVTVGGIILAAVTSSVFADAAVAMTVTIILFGLLALWSLYMVSASIFALYIVTLPDMQPRQALRSARDLVRFRRFTVVRKVFFLPLLIFMVMGIIIVPLILYVSAIVPAVFYILSMLAILFVNSYLYNLYRELLE